MPRPNDKESLLIAANENYSRLINFIDNLDSGYIEKEFPKGMLNRNIRDVLAHLHHWHLLMNTWYNVGMKGQKPDIPSKGYTWKTTPELNQEIQKTYNSIELENIKSKLATTHMNMINTIENHSNDELFTKKYYKWTGTTSLGAYFISSTSSHYDWALKVIKKALK